MNDYNPFIVTAFLVGPPAALADTAHQYYVALGDSVAAIENGYPEQLAATLSHDTPKLELVNLSCLPTPLATGPTVAFLKAHRQFVKLVTINLGAGDVFELGAEAGLVQIQHNLPVILAALREAAEPDVPIVRMNDYQPFVVAWFDDPAAAHDAVDAAVQFNDVLEASYVAAGSPVADVETAFSVTDFTVQPDGLPLNVKRVCQWTLMCTAGDTHPSNRGSAVVAHAFEAVLL